MEIWLLLVALVLAGLGLWLLVRASRAYRVTGLPVGRIAYVDTGAWNRCERPLFSRRYRLTGKPDYLVGTPAGVIPVEVKSGAAPQQPYPAHVLQLAAYCLLVEEQESQTVPYGIIKYADKAFEVDYTPALRVQVLDTLEAMRRGLRTPERVGLERSHNEPQRCLGCGYRDQCGQRLA
jgi:CRISPR-associated exonuclease Cas4